MSERFQRARLAILFNKFSSNGTASGLSKFSQQRTSAKIFCLIGLAIVLGQSTQLGPSASFHSLSCSENFLRELSERNFTASIICEYPPQHLCQSLSGSASGLSSSTNPISQPMSFTVSQSLCASASVLSECALRFYQPSAFCHYPSTLEWVRECTELAFSAEL